MSGWGPNRFRIGPSGGVSEHYVERLVPIMSENVFITEVTVTCGVWILLLGVTSIPRDYSRFSGPNLGRGLSSWTTGRSYRMVWRFENQKEKDGVTNIKGNDATDFSKFIKRPPWNKYVQAELCACVLHPILFWKRLFSRHVERCCLPLVPCTAFPFSNFSFRITICSRCYYAVSR